MPDITNNPMPSPASTLTGERSPETQSGAVATAASQAGDEAHALKDEAVSVAADVKDRAAAEATNVADSARAEAGYVIGEVREEFAGHADDAARRLATTISAAADELRSMADRSEQPTGPMTTMVRQLAERSSEVGRRLESDGYRGVADDVARFGRNRPGMFLLAAGAAGFAVGRMLRNTDTQAVVNAAKNELRDRDPDSGPGLDRSSTVLPGSAERPADTATLSDAYAPTLGSGSGGR